MYLRRTCIITCMHYINVSRYSITFRLQLYSLHAFSSTFTLTKNTNKMKSKLKRFTIQVTEKCVDHNTQMILSPPRIHFKGEIDNYSGKILRGNGGIIDTIAKPGG